MSPLQDAQKHMGWGEGVYKSNNVIAVGKINGKGGNTTHSFYQFEMNKSLSVLSATYYNTHPVHGGHVGTYPR